jgi:hypothetical protein
MMGQPIDRLPQRSNERPRDFGELCLEGKQLEPVPQGKPSI